MHGRHGKWMERALALLAVTAVIAASVSPAAARDRYRHPGYGYGYGGGWYGSPYRGRHYRHHRGLDAGDVIGIAAVLGAVAVIASSANKDKRSTRSSDRDYDPDYRRDDDRSDDFAAGYDEDEAVNACASAAREEAERGGGFAEIVDVDEPRSAGRDGWRIQGSLEHRRAYQDRSGLQKNFTCSYEGGRVVRVDVRDYVT